MTWAEVEAMIKSCVLSKKGDMTLNDLRGEYSELVGEDIPFKSLGCESLEALLNKLSGISVKKNPRGQLIVVACSQKAGHIADLVNKQRTVPKKTYKAKRRTMYSSKKHIRPPVRITSKHSESVNLGIPVKEKMKQQSRKYSANSSIPTFGLESSLTKKSGFKKRSVNRRRLSYTQVRYIPAGEENSDDSVDEGFECPSSTEDTSVGKSSVHTQPLADGRQRPFRYRMDDSYDEDSSSSVGSYHRIVNVTGNGLTCTISMYPPSSSRERSPPVPAARSVIDFSDDSQSCSAEDFEFNSSWDSGPIMLGYHLVGDDFLLQFAYECLHVDCQWEDHERLSCGMCISGQTIHDFHMQVRHEGFIQPKIALMLGAVDILQDSSLRRIIVDMSDLLEDLMNSPMQSLVLLTLPFLRNGGVANQKVWIFNEFLRTMDDGQRICVLDAHAVFNKRSFREERTYENSMNPKCYEGVTRDILCYPQGVVLWSHLGRCYLYNFLLQQLTHLDNTAHARKKKRSVML